jgi:hypothetical protein
MFAAALLLSAQPTNPPRVGACDPDMADARHLPLGPHVDADGCASEITLGYDGHRFYANPLCVECDHAFAAPQIGRVCCVCIAKKSSKINDL